MEQDGIIPTKCDNDTELFEEKGTKTPEIERSGAPVRGPNKSTKELKRWKPWRKALYVAYALNGFLLLFSALTLFFPTLLANIPLHLGETVVSNDAVSSVIKAVGTPALVIGPLLGIMRQRVYGERVGKLIRWAYPGFFLYYFLLFVPTILAGIYAGGLQGRRLPACLALLGTLLGTCLIARVCYLFLLSLEKCEKIAFSYYMEKLEEQSSKVCPRRARKNMDTSKQIMFKVANAVLCGQREGERVCAARVCALWEKCTRSGAAVRSNAILAKEFWDILCVEGPGSQQYQQLLLDILFAREPVGAADVDDTLLTGLLLTDPFCRPGAGLDWGEACGLLRTLAQRCNREVWPAPVLSKAFWGLTMTMAVYEYYNAGRVNFDSLMELAPHLGVTLPGSGDKAGAESLANAYAAFVRNWRELYMDVSGLTGGTQVYGVGLSYEDARDQYMINHVDGFSPPKENSDADDLLYLTLLLEAR